MGKEVSFIWDVITYPCEWANLKLGHGWVIIHIPLVFMDVIAYPCPNTGAALVNLC